MGRMGCSHKTIAKSSTNPALVFLPFFGCLNSIDGPMPIEFPSKFAYAKDADEFVRQRTRRVRTGWRRDEWAHSPLFICGKFTWANAPKAAEKIG
jgi:hypothetical protein